MAEAQLPEEIIYEIISLCLPFSEKTFLNFPEDGRPHWQQECRDTHEEPSTNILLLSKRWLRIGTPILYKGVCIRETRRMKGVAQLVKNDPAIGRMIRYLRLEGGMGRDLYTLVRYTPNADTLYVSLQILCLPHHHLKKFSFEDQDGNAIATSAGPTKN